MQPAQPEVTPPQQPQKKEPSKAVKVVAGVIVALVAACCVGVGVAFLNDNDTSSTSNKGTPINQNTQPAKPAEQPKQEVTPKPEDFVLTAKTLEKECFGSAGCLITYRIEVAYGGPKLPDDVTYEITYDVKGGEEPKSGRLTVRGDEYEVDESEIISTKSSKDKLTVVVTSVSKLY